MTRAELITRWLVLLLLGGAQGSISLTQIGPLSAFQSIASTGSIVSFTGSVSQQTLPFNFSWTSSGASTVEGIQTIYVANNGDVLFYTGTAITLSSSTMSSICTNGGSGDSASVNPHIAVMKMVSYSTGSVYVQSKTSSFIVSYEKMGTSGGIANMSGQVEIFSNGNFELRYSINTSLKGSTFMAGVGVIADGYCVAAAFGGCNSANGLCTTFPANSGGLFGKIIILAFKSSSL
jgi:hypothetical protein